MALILSLETTGQSCSVALHNNGILINTLEIIKPQEHAAQLAVLIDKIFRESREKIEHLSAVSVSSGPGSYTGLRIGTSTAKGICFALKIPFIAIPTLDLLCIQFRKNDIGQKGLLCPMIDAKRMEVYCQIIDRDNRVIRHPQAVIVDPASFDELLDQQTVFFFGDGASKCRTMIQHPNARFQEVSAKASAMGEISFEKLEKGHVEDLVNYTPFYLKDFIAKKAPSVF